jgi:hypothetical protein
MTASLALKESWVITVTVRPAAGAAVTAAGGWVVAGGGVGKLVQPAKTNTRTAKNIVRIRLYMMHLLGLFVCLQSRVDHQQHPIPQPDLRFHPLKHIADPARLAEIESLISQRVSQPRGRDACRVPAERQEGEQVAGRTGKGQVSRPACLCPENCT